MSLTPASESARLTVCALALRLPGFLTVTLTVNASPAASDRGRAGGFETFSAGAFAALATSALEQPENREEQPDGHPPYSPNVRAGHCVRFSLPSH